MKEVIKILKNKMIKKYFSRKLTLLTLATLLSFPTNIFGLSLIDKLDYDVERFPIGREIDDIDLKLKSSPMTFSERDYWNNFRLKSDFKYLMRDNVLHEFDKNGEYQKTIIKNMEDLSNNENKDIQKNKEDVYNVKYLTFLEKEKERYLKSGFKDIPKLHISTIKDDVSYFNQLNNDIKADISCVPTASTMFLHINNFKELVPDNLSKDISFSSDGSTTDDSLSVLRKHYNLGYTTYDYDISLSKIQQRIKENTPIIAYVKAGYIDYEYMTFEEKETNTRRNRLYKVNESQKDRYSHALLITGYLEIEDVTYLEIYDPWSLFTIWADGKPIPSGKGKFMKYDDFKRIENGPLVHFDVKGKKQ